ncbi:MAG: RCC1 domain-containing protein, partial [Sandaracinaceae bacterium]
MNDRPPHTGLAAGLHHSLLLQAGRVFRCGVRNGKVVPGAGDVTPTFEPVAGLPDVEFVSVACGYHHSLALTVDGALWVFGTSQFGQLGLGAAGTEEVPPTVASFSRPVQSIAAGAFHSLVVDEAGVLWAFGLGKQHQLGVGRRTRDNPTPRQTDLEGAIRAAWGGDAHSVALTPTGELFSFGRGRTGCLGSRGDRPKPKPV